MSEETNTRQKVLDEVKVLPDKPGVYQFYDLNEKIIYVGKAKSLKKRVASYFNKDASLSGKLKVLVGKIHFIQTIVVASETDALLLENNLIKKHQPRYNILLKDDKTFPWLCIKNEPFPRVFPTRNRINDGSEYFGPYASVTMMKTLLSLIRQLYPLRTCKLRLNEKSIRAGRFRVCLEYHIGNCRGPCEGHETQSEYDETVAQIRDIIRGNLVSVTGRLKELMMQYAAAYEFEKAHKVKEKLLLLENYKAKSTIVNTSIQDLDVCSIVDGEQSVYSNYLRVIQGAVVQSHTIELRRILDEPLEELFQFAIAEFRQRYASTASEMLVPSDPGVAFDGIKFVVPKKGDKKLLLELSERNAKWYRLEKEKQRDLVDPERRTRKLLDSMKNDLRLKAEPVWIECFDNSNIQGKHAVAAMSVFRNGKPEKKEYRHFNIKTVEGPNDFASMEEVINRRYSRLLKEERPLPNLIIVDGGKGQLSSAWEILKKLEISDKVDIIGIAKRLEELFYPDDPVPLYIDKKSVSLKVIQHARDEAHLFGISHHRNKRSKGMIDSILSGIEGIGTSSTDKLLQKYKSVSNIEKAGIEELTEMLGKDKANRVYAFFHQQESP